MYTLSRRWKVGAPPGEMPILQTNNVIVILFHKTLFINVLLRKEFEILIWIQEKVFVKLISKR